jgi:ribosomal protein S18 acetylase RimI-like enzyme
MNIQKFQYNEFPKDEVFRNAINFLYVHLEQFGDSKEDIEKAFDYAFSEEPGKGGYILVGYEQKEIIGAVVINCTGMQGYIPENILVYIAIHKNYRGKGYGKQLLIRAIEESEGNIALHVENNNPAKFLYDKMGFETKYLEMRLEK